MEKLRYQFLTQEVLITLIYKKKWQIIFTFIFWVSAELYLNFKLYKRIISRLDVKNGILVKGINLEGLRNLGDPEHFSKIYYNQKSKFCALFWSYQLNSPVNPANLPHLFGRYVSYRV